MWWARESMWDRSIELGMGDRWVITSRPPWAIEHWLESGLVRVPQERVWQSIRAALAEVRASDVPALWRCLFEYASGHPRSLCDFERELTRAARDPISTIIVLERRIERGFRGEPLVWDFQPPPRTQTEHYVVIEAVDAGQRPVAGLRIELLIADGEVKSAQTDGGGIARLERIQAGRVVIRVLGIDGNRWRPAAGAPAQESSRERPTTHVVGTGDNLSRIARKYGLRGWRAIWDDPKNEVLRKQRRSPHVLHPGDAVHVPGMPVFEIERETDATHRIVLESYRFESDLGLRLTTEFATRLTSGAFALWGRAVFGEDIPRAAFEQLRLELQGGTLPAVEARLSTRLGDHPAAYDSSLRAVLVAEDIVLEACTDRAGYAAMLACVLVEEFGHFLDDLLRHQLAKVGGDAPRDEGARFACLLLTEALSTVEPLRVGALFIDGVTHDIVADPSELKEIVRAVLGPAQQRSDERTQSREYADALGRASNDDGQQGEILYLTLLLAGYSLLDAHALVDLARKLNARWRGKAGPAVFYESRPPAEPGPALERVILSYLLALYRELDSRIRSAPLAEDGLPDLGEPRWTLEPGEALWDPGSPLAGLLEDIAPFGSHDEWVARLCELDRERQPRATRVRRRARARPQESRATLPDRAPGPSGFVTGLDELSDAASGEAGPTPIDDALNAADRAVGAVDTVISLLELVGVEVAGSAVVAVAGPLLMLGTFVSGLAKVDGQQLAAAKAMGVMFAYFAIRRAASMNPPPSEVTVEDVQREVSGDIELTRIRASQSQWRGGTPQAVLDEGEKDGIKLVLDALHSNLARGSSRAQSAYDRMILEARLGSLNEPEQERRRLERELSAAYPLDWWAVEIRRRTYAEFANSIEAQARAVFNRLHSDRIRK